MLAWRTLFVKYFYSTSISELPSFVRKILQREENKGVELTGGWRGKLEGSGKRDGGKGSQEGGKGRGELQRTGEWAASPPEVPTYL